MYKIELYKILIETRNFEINLFWQRANYFLVLNTALAVGFFGQEHGLFRLIIVIGGFLSSFLWYFVCLGGKFWQARWEQRLADFEKENMGDINFFYVSQEQIKKDVENNMSSEICIKGLCYKQVLKKPSVSYQMVKLSVIFIAFWALCFAVFLTNKNMLFDIFHIH
ncbi:MAG: hypothetical protein M0Z78_02715 [Betaproteobacteria bacterium]|nr:hypothetical protein [Betaproteobacteria bacterium]